MVTVEVENCGVHADSRPFRHVPKKSSVSFWHVDWYLTQPSTICQFVFDFSCCGHLGVFPPSLRSASPSDQSCSSASSDQCFIGTGARNRGRAGSSAVGAASSRALRAAQDPKWLVWACGCCVPWPQKILEFVQGLHTQRTCRKQIDPPKLTFEAQLPSSGVENPMLLTEHHPLRLTCGLFQARASPCCHHPRCARAVSHPPSTPRSVYPR